jgi:hypothetical protein
MVRSCCLAETRVFVPTEGTALNLTLERKVLRSNELDDTEHATGCVSCEHYGSDHLNFRVESDVLLQLKVSGVRRKVPANLSL